MLEKMTLVDVCCGHFAIKRNVFILAPQGGASPRPSALSPFFPLPVVCPAAAVPQK